MALKLTADEAAYVAVKSIGCGYDMSLDLRFRNGKNGYFGSYRYRNCRLIEIEVEQGRDIMLPDGLLILNVPKSIKCDKGERTRFQSGVLSFQQMSELFNQELSLDGTIPSGLFNAMFEFSGSWQKDASSTKTLAFDGVFISLYTVALEKSQMVLCDHVKKAVPSSWEPDLLAWFIETYGTHITVGVTMGAKDVIYMKLPHVSSLEPADVQKKLTTMADKRFLDSDSESEHISQNDEDFVSICKRRGGSDDKNLTHNEWLRSVRLEPPDVINMSFVSITSLLNGVQGSGYLTHAINLYLCYKPPIQELRHFLEFQLPRQWAPVHSHLSLGPQREQQNMTSLPFSGPELHINTNMVDVGKRPVMGLRLYLEGKRSNQLAIHLQHLSSLPKIFQLDSSVTGITNSGSDDSRYFERVQFQHFSHVCTAPVESEDENSIVTGARLHIKDYGNKKVICLQFRFSVVLGAVLIKMPEWDGPPVLEPGQQRQPAEVSIDRGIYPLGPPVAVEALKLLEYVDTTEMTRGPQDSPGYWVVSGGRLSVDKGKISLRVKYSLLNSMNYYDEEEAYI